MTRTLIEKKKFPDESFQFALLANLCSISHDIVSDAVAQLENTRSIITRMLLESEIYRQVNTTSYFALLVDTPKLLKRVLVFVRELIQWNGFVSGLETNHGIVLNSIVDGSPVIQPIGSLMIDPSNISYDCSAKICSISPAGFYELNTTTNSWPNWSLFVDHNPSNALDYAWGFTASTTILEGLLESRLDCLHEWTCLHMLQRYFPLLTQVCQNGEDN